MRMSHDMAGSEASTTADRTFMILTRLLSGQATSVRPADAYPRPELGRQVSSEVLGQLLISVGPHLAPGTFPV